MVTVFSPSAFELAVITYFHCRLLLRIGGENTLLPPIRKPTVKIGLGPAGKISVVVKVSSCQLLNLLIAFGLLSQLTSILIHELALRCRCFWNMQMWKDRPKRRRACTGGSLVETRWSLCSTPRTSSTQSSMMDEVRKPMLELPEDKFTAEQYD